MRFSQSILRDKASLKSAGFSPGRIERDGTSNGEKLPLVLVLLCHFRLHPIIGGNLACCSAQMVTMR
jgi:hypothetical protein